MKRTYWAFQVTPLKKAENDKLKNFEGKKLALTNVSAGVSDFPYKAEAKHILSKPRAIVERHGGDLSFSDKYRVLARRKLERKQPEVKIGSEEEPRADAQFRPQFTLTNVATGVSPGFKESFHGYDSSKVPSWSGKVLASAKKPTAVKFAKKKVSKGGTSSFFMMAKPPKKGETPKQFEERVGRGKAESIKRIKRFGGHLGGVVGQIGASWKEEGPYAYHGIGRWIQSFAGPEHKPAISGWSGKVLASAKKPTVDKTPKTKTMGDATFKVMEQGQSTVEPTLEKPTRKKKLPPEKPTRKKKLPPGKSGVATILPGGGYFGKLPKKK